MAIFYSWGCKTKKSSVAPPGRRGVEKFLRREKFSAGERARERDAKCKGVSETEREQERARVDERSIKIRHYGRLVLLSSSLSRCLLRGYEYEIMPKWRNHLQQDTTAIVQKLIPVLQAHFRAHWKQLFQVLVAQVLFNVFYNFYF